jgi:hypothetical protein
MYNSDRTVRFSVTPFGSSYTDYVRVAVGDVTGDGVADVVATSNGSGTTAARVAVIDGTDGSLVSTPSLVPANYFGMLSVSVGDTTGDGVAEIALGSNEGGPRARLYRGGDFAKLADFLAGTGTNNLGRPAIALGDLNADGFADLVISSRYTNGSRVYGFDGTSLVPGVSRVSLFTPFTLTGSFGAGLHMAVGDVNADGFGDLVLGSYSGVTPRVNVYSGLDLTFSDTRVRLASFAPAGNSSSTGVKVAVRDIDGDGILDILTSSGEQASAFQGGTLPPTGRPPLLFAYDPDPTVTGGVWIG